MNVKRKWIVGGVIALGSFVAVAWWLFPHEPRYAGKALSEWLADLDAPATKGPAMEAIQLMGTNAWPIVLEELSAVDMPLRLRMVMWATNQSLVSIRISTASLRRQRAAIACQALGPLAKEAVPQLAAMLNDPKTESLGDVVAGALDSIGQEGMAVMLSALSGTNSLAAVRALRQIERGVFVGPEMEQPIMEAKAHHPKSRFIQLMADDLVHRGYEYARRGPGMMGTLANAKSRCVVVMYFGRQGAKAKTAIPELEKALNDPAAEVRVEVRNALIKIREAMTED